MKIYILKTLLGRWCWDMVKFENRYSMMPKKRNHFIWLVAISFLGIFFLVSLFKIPLVFLISTLHLGDLIHSLRFNTHQCCSEIISLPLSPFAHLCKQHLVNRHFLLDWAKNQAGDSWFFFSIFSHFSVAEETTSTTSAEETTVVDFPP